MSNQTQVAIVKPVEIVSLTTKQAAQALQVSQRTIFNLIAAGKLPSVKINNTRRIAVDALRRLAKYGSEEAGEKAAGLAVAAEGAGR